MGRFSKNPPIKIATVKLINIKLAVVEIKPNRIAISRLATMMASDLFRSNWLTAEFILLKPQEDIMTMNFLALEIVNLGFLYFVP